MDLSDRGNPAFESLMGVVRGAKLEYAQRRVEAPAYETMYRRYRKERERARLAKAVYEGSLAGLSTNALKEAYGTLDIRAVNKLINEGAAKARADEDGEQYFEYTEEDIAWRP